MQNDWPGRFRVIVPTDFKKCSLEKRFKVLDPNPNPPAWRTGRSNSRNFINFAPIDFKFCRNILKILCIQLNRPRKQCTPLMRFLYFLPSFLSRYFHIVPANIK